jgi:hypothetical protein
LCCGTGSAFLHASWQKKQQQGCDGNYLIPPHVTGTHNMSIPSSAVTHLWAADVQENLAANAACVASNMSTCSNPPCPLVQVQHCSLPRSAPPAAAGHLSHPSLASHSLRGSRLGVRGKHKPSHTFPWLHGYKYQPAGCRHAVAQRRLQPGTLPPFRAAEDPEVTVPAVYSPIHKTHPLTLLLRIVSSGRWGVLAHVERLQASWVCRDAAHKGPNVCIAAKGPARDANYQVPAELDAGAGVQLKHPLHVQQQGWATAATRVSHNMHEADAASVCCLWRPCRDEDGDKCRMKWTLVPEFNSSTTAHSQQQR